MAEGNGNTKTGLVGLFLLVGSSAALYLELMPWWAAIGLDGLGVYFLIPNRMTGAGDYFMSLYIRFRGWELDAHTQAEITSDESENGTT